MAGRRNSGDRHDGRRLRSLGGFFNLIPFIMPDRNDALVYFDQALEISSAERWFKRQRADGYKGMGMLYLIIAAYVRCVAAFPALNRFVVGRRVYAHEDIVVNMAVKRSLSSEAEETVIKVRFDPSDTVYDVYRKMNKAIEDARAAGDNNDTDSIADKLGKLPKPILRFVMFIIRVLDNIGLLPRKLLDASPFHGSMIITDLGSLGIGPVYHHIYNFGTLPVFISFGAKRKAYEITGEGKAAERRYVDARFAVDERIVDGYCLASAFKLMQQYISEPSLLEIPPEVVKRDVR